MAEQSRSVDRAIYRQVHRRPRCEAQIPGVCRQHNEHAHHRRMRSQHGRTELDNLIACCDACHWVIHNPPPRTATRWSYRHGLLVPSWMPWEDCIVVAGHDLTCDIDHTGAG